MFSEERDDRLLLTIYPAELKKVAHMELIFIVGDTDVIYTKF